MCFERVSERVLRTKMSKISGRWRGSKILPNPGFFDNLEGIKPLGLLSDSAWPRYLINCYLFYTEVLRSLKLTLR